MEVVLFQRIINFKPIISTQTRFIAIYFLARSNLMEDQKIKKETQRSSTW